MRLLTVALSLAATSRAALRFGCSTLTIQSLDPIVEPGQVPSAHLHQIVGGNAFNATMEGDVGERGTCTTCTFSEDFSNYWTAVMFFKHPNGTYKRVPLMQNTALPMGINGGMTIYYTQESFYSNGRQKITAFPPVCIPHANSSLPHEADMVVVLKGFRMTVGSPEGDDKSRHTGLRFVCLETKGTRFPELADFPPRPCKGGIMTVHHFPS